MPVSRVHETAFRPASNVSDASLATVAEQAGPILRGFNWSKDIETVASFQDDNFSTNFPDFVMTRRFDACFRQDIKRAGHNRNHGLFVIEVGGRVVAFLWVAVYCNSWTGERYGYVNNIYVCRECRNRGLGKQLLNKAESFFRSRRVRKIRLTVTCSNPEAIALYEKMGYQTTRNEMEKEIYE